MNNPRINSRLLRQALASQFSRVMFRNGEMDKFDNSYEDLSNSQKQSLFALGTDIAQLELKIRIDNVPNPKEMLIEVHKYVILSGRQVANHCKECGDTGQIVHIRFHDGSYDYSIHCEDHIPTPES